MRVTLCHLRAPRLDLDWLWTQQLRNKKVIIGYWYDTMMHLAFVPSSCAAIKGCSHVTRNTNAFYKFEVINGNLELLNLQINCVRCLSRSGAIYFRKSSAKQIFVIKCWLYLTIWKWTAFLWTTVLFFIFPNQMIKRKKKRKR